MAAAMAVPPRLLLLLSLLISFYLATPVNTSPPRTTASLNVVAAHVQRAIIDGINLSPAATSALSAEALQVSVAMGTGEYLVRVAIGSPPMPFNLVLDTTSDITWVRCEPCTDCNHRIFDPSASSSYAPVSCGSARCDAANASACRNGTCHVSRSEGRSSQAIGHLATETITLGDSSFSGFVFGCSHININQGYFDVEGGILGLGRGSLSFPSQIHSKSFSYCLVDQDSPNTSTLDFGSGLGDSSVTAAMINNPKLDRYYYVNMTGISVGGQMLPFPQSFFAVNASGYGGIIIDSAMPITLLQQEAYNSIRDAFVKATTHLPRIDGIMMFDTCYHLSNGTSNVEVPTVAFHFSEGNELRLPGKNSLAQMGYTEAFCFAFAPIINKQMSMIIGSLQQQGTRVAFDLENSVVGFAPNKC